MSVPGQGQEPNPQAGQEPGGQASNAQPQTPPPAGQEPQQPPAGETFTREYVEGLRREAADYRKRATTAEGKVTEHERQQLSETERKDAEIADLKARATDLESKYQTALIHSALRSEAHTQGAVDADAVVLMVDRSGLEIQDDGSIKGVEKAVKALLEAKPYLKAEGAQPAGNGARTQAVPGTPRPNSGKPAGRPEDIDNRAKVLQQSGAYPRF